VPDSKLLNVIEITLGQNVIFLNAHVAKDINRVCCKIDAGSAETG